jgi:hypothetical protein
MKKLIILLLLASIPCFAQMGIGSASVVSKLNLSGGANIYGDFGLQYYIAPHVSLRGTVGTTLTSGGGNTFHETSASGAFLVDIGGPASSLYVGPTLKYFHSTDNTEGYEYGGVVGVRVYHILADPIALGWEYPVTHRASEGIHTWTFGKTTGEFIVNIQL